jgi:hypothetical protein
MISKSIAHRLANIELKRRVSLPALVVFYRGSSGLTQEQQCRVNDAKQSVRPVRLIKTCIVNG